MKIRPGNHQHIGTRKEQQDAFAFSDLSDAAFVRHAGMLALLADGMGGLKEGGEASRLAIRAFLESYARKTPEETIDEALDRSLREANDAVHTFAAARDLVGNCGTTLVAAVVHKSGVYWTSAGDSRLYMTDGQSLTPLTEDHIYARKLEKAVEKGILDEKDALSHPEREALTSYIGDEEIAIVGKGSLAGSPEGLPGKGFMLLLCTDGLYKTLSEEKMLEVYSPDPGKWARTLVDTAVSENIPSQDNITVLCLAAGDPAPRRRRPAPRKKTVAIIAVVAVLLLLAGGFLWRLSSRTDPEMPTGMAVQEETGTASRDETGPHQPQTEEESPTPPERPVQPENTLPAPEKSDSAVSSEEQVRLPAKERMSLSSISPQEPHRKGERG